MTNDTCTKEVGDGKNNKGQKIIVFVLYPVVKYVCLVIEFIVQCKNLEACTSEIVIVA